MLAAAATTSPLAGRRMIACSAVWAKTRLSAAQAMIFWTAAIAMTAWWALAAMIPFLAVWAAILLTAAMAMTPCLAQAETTLLSPETGTIWRTAAQATI